MAWFHPIPFRTRKLSKPTFRIVLRSAREVRLAATLIFLKSLLFYTHSTPIYQMKKQNKEKLKQIALEKVKTLFNEIRNNSSKANDNVRKARRIAMKVNLPIPKELKRKYCKHCNNYFKLGNYRVRTRNSMVIYSCFNCKKYMKFKTK